MSTTTAPAARQTLRRATRQTMAAAVADRAPFRYSRSARGDWLTADAAHAAVSSWASRLEPEAVDVARAALSAAGDDDALVYVVRSYDTVAAIYVPATGVWWTWNTRHSVTTSTHQRLIRQGIDRVGF